jgi:hypothetical protein
MRPKRIGPAAAATGGESRLLVDPSPREAAREILKFLETERLLPRPRAGEGDKQSTQSHAPEKTP